MTKNLDHEGLSSIANNYELFYIDLWGVIHNGIILYKEAVKVLKELELNGKEYVLLTNAPRPDHVTALPIALPMLIIIKREMIYIKIPRPISAINSDSIYSCIHGFNLGTKIIVIIKASNHLEKDNKLIVNPFAAHCAIE